MIKKIKTMLGNIIAATISILILCSWFVLPFEAQATVTTAPRYTAPSAGAGRVETKPAPNPRNTLACVETCVETSVDTIETETAEFEPYIASETQEEKENETIYQYTEVYPVVETEECIEVLPDLDPIIETDIDALIVQVAAEYGLPWQLVRAVVWAESTFDPYAVSDHPDYGLMQVWEQVWIDHGYDPKDPIVFDPETNLRMGCKVLKQKIDAHDGDFANALTCYRFGDGGALEKWRHGEYSNWYNERVLVKYYEYLRG